jgi:hypothetical protein
MMLDSLLRFEPSALAITTTATSTDQIDLINARDIGSGRIGAYVTAIVGTAFASSTATATLTIQLQVAPNNGGVAGIWNTIASSPAIPLGQLAANQKVLQMPFPNLSEIPTAPVTTTGTFSSSSTSVTVASATGILNGTFVSGAGIVPGTTVASGAGTTSLTLSDNTSAAGTAVALTFSPVIPTPRFVRLRYVASNTMTAGTLSFAGIVLDEDNNLSYAPGFTAPV